MSLKHEILNFVKEDEIVNLLQQLVKIPSPTGEEKNLAEYIYEVLKSWGLKTEIFDVFPNRPDVVGFLEGLEGKPTLILNGHLDHVPPGNLEDWSFNPYDGKIVDGKLYGRGAADMKGGLTAMMVTAKILKDLNVKLKGNLVLTFAIGEEKAEPGTKYLVVDKGIKGDWGIVVEPTVYKGKFRIAVAERGLAWLHITVKGKPAHASQPQLGVNAIIKANKIITELEKYGKKLAKKTHPFLGNPTCTVTMVEGGFKENVVPDRCKITVDRRINPDETVKRAKKELENVLKKLRRKDPKLKFSVEVSRVFEPAEIPADLPIVKTVRKNFKMVCGYDSKPWGAPYACDARNLINDAGIPAIVFGPGDLAQCHSIDEYVKISDVITVTKVLLLTVLDFLV